eukprot:scaffold380526_cov43-Prasinocladus_malaysianus.AAC.2
MHELRAVPIPVQHVPPAPVVPLDTASPAVARLAVLEVQGMIDGLVLLACGINARALKANA